MARRFLADLFTKKATAKTGPRIWGKDLVCNQCGEGPLDHDMIDLEECFEYLEGVGWDD